MKFSRLARRGVLLGLSGSQLVVVGIGAVTLVFALYLGGGILLAYAAPLILSVRHSRGWAPVVASSSSGCRSSSGGCGARRADNSCTGVASSSPGQPARSRCPATPRACGSGSTPRPAR